jgi:hypothetical protein
MQANAVNSKQVALECGRAADIGPWPCHSLVLRVPQVSNCETSRIKGDRMVIVGRTWWNPSRFFTPEPFTFDSRSFQPQPMLTRSIPAKVDGIRYADENCEKADEQDFWDVRTNHARSFAAERKGQRSEPAADDVRFVSERIGWLPFAAPPSSLIHLSFCPQPHDPQQEQAGVGQPVNPTVLAIKLPRTDRPELVPPIER